MQGASCAPNTDLLRLFVGRFLWAFQVQVAHDQVDFHVQVFNVGQGQFLLLDLSNVAAPDFPGLQSIVELRDQFVRTTKTGADWYWPLVATIIQVALYLTRYEG